MSAYSWMEATHSLSSECVFCVCVCVHACPCPKWAVACGKGKSMTLASVNLLTAR